LKNKNNKKISDTLGDMINNNQILNNEGDTIKLDNLSEMVKQRLKKIGYDDDDMIKVEELKPQELLDMHKEGLINLKKDAESLLKQLINSNLHLQLPDSLYSDLPPLNSLPNLPSCLATSHLPISSLPPSFQTVLKSLPTYIPNCQSIPLSDLPASLLSTLLNTQFCPILDKETQEFIKNAKNDEQCKSIFDM
jgi:hypothetical protein